MKPGEPIQLDYSLETKDGQPLTFYYTYDSEPTNRGFVVDKLEAFIGEEKVGYIRAMYVGGARVGHFYPSILNYIAQIQGASVLPYRSACLDPAEASPETLNIIAERLNAYRFTDKPSEHFSDYQAFRDWFTQQAKTNFKLRKATKDFKAFLHRAVDKPHVDFVCTEKSPENGVLEGNQGRWIGTALYQVMALELDKRGLDLRSGTLQSPEARRIWDTFKKKGWAYEEEDRLVLDARSFELILQGSRAPAF